MSRPYPKLAPPRNRGGFNGELRAQVFVSAHEGHHHADAPTMSKEGGGDTGASSSLAPFSATLMVGLVGIIFSFARI
uniref:Uncharacterized protein n=1 Tax=Chenopodium quinoa TaxID=63459 RepID=A0A803MBV4_CHEQI